jgi:hypothetical protein
MVANYPEVTRSGHTPERESLTVANGLNWLLCLSRGILHDICQPDSKCPEWVNKSTVDSTTGRNRLEDIRSEIVWLTLDLRQGRNQPPVSSCIAQPSSVRRIHSCSWRTIPKYRVSRHGMGGRMHRLAEESRKIPNLVLGVQDRGNFDSVGASAFQKRSVLVCDMSATIEKVVVKNTRGATSGVSEVDRPYTAGSCTANQFVNEYLTQTRNRKSFAGEKLSQKACAWR